MILDPDALYVHASHPGWWRFASRAATTDDVTFVNENGETLTVGAIEVLAGVFQKTKERRAMIEVKTGQRWKRNDTGEALNIGKPTAGHNVWYCVEAGAGCVSAQWLNQRATLTYDPDEGEAPEVGSRWEWGSVGRVTVKRIGIAGSRPGVVGGEEGQLAAWVQWCDGSRGWWPFSYFFPDEPTPEADERASDGCTDLSCLLGEAERRNAETVTGGECAVPGCSKPYEVRDPRRFVRTCKPCRAVAVYVEPLGAAIAAFAKRAPAREPTRDELLEHWMSLRPDDLHEGGWRRVGVAQISGDADMDDGLHTFEHVTDAAEGIAHGIQQGSPWSFVRLYREEERRGKWWVS